MTRSPETVPPNLTLRELVDEYFLQQRYQAYPVTQNGQPLGIIVVDLRAVAGHYHNLVEAAYPKIGAFCIPPNSFSRQMETPSDPSGSYAQARLALVSFAFILGTFCLFLSVYDASSGALIIPLLIVVTLFAGIWGLNLQAAKQIERGRDAWFGNSLAA